MEKTREDRGRRPEGLRITPVIEMVRIGCGLCLIVRQYEYIFSPARMTLRTLRTLRTIKTLRIRGVKRRCGQGVGRSALTVDGRERVVS